MKIVFGFFLLALITFSCKNKSAEPSGQDTYKNIDVSGAKQYIINSPNLIILDVRTPGETKDGMIPNAIEIDYKNSNFETEINKLDKSKSYLVYCRSGGRSVSACEIMSAAGFTDLTNMEGGYSAWK